MSFFEKIRSIDTRFAWGFIGVILALIFGGITIYTSFVQNRKPNLRFEVISNTSVLDVHEQISKLQLLFDGNNIHESGQTLRIVTLRVVNDGQMDILKTSYDDTDPVGFVLTDGAIVDKPELLHVSNEYLGRNLKLNLETPQKVTFSNVILETGESYTIKLLILSLQSSIPDVSPVGKIAGVKTIQVSRPYRERSEETFVRRTFGGWALIQFVRVVAYGIVFIILLIVLISIVAGMSELLDRLRKRRLVSEFKRRSKTNFNQNDEVIFKLFLRTSGYYLQELQSELSSPVLKEDVKALLKRKSLKSYIDRERSMWSDLEHGYVPLGGSIRRARALLDSGFVTPENDDVIINEEMRSTLDHFVSFLKIKNEIQPVTDETISAASIFADEASKPL